MIAPDPPFILTENEKATLLWARIKGHLNDKLAAARRRNDTPQSEQETAMLRGEIKTLKGIIALGDDRPVTGDTGTP